MRVADFDFDLPDDRIALRPVSPRDAAKMLVVNPHGTPAFADMVVRDLPDILRPGDALVLNDTRVIPARLRGMRHRSVGEGATIEAQLLKRVADDQWRALAKPAKRLAAGDLVQFGSDSNACLMGALNARVLEKGEAGEVLLGFEFAGAALDAAIAAHGFMPLPPYIAAKRPPDQQDHADYQTLFARNDGAVAAPTASLHFTKDIMERLTARGISQHTVTLHVGAGTFLPVKAEDTRDHVMHAEWGAVDAQTASALNDVRKRGGRIIAVGTTALRLLESAADEAGVLHPFAGETAIFITPGYRFRCADVLVTNFHLPKSTLFMLVSAFCGTDLMRQAYAHAITHGYRFYSYGDSSLLFRA
ncbi:MAG: tRNA preQ1(34) S-adenosylmethionine ribosyltransferase-isomerase QueA [Beijerinckiaceae bacterium]